MSHQTSANSCLVVTGAGSGIGLAIVRCALDRGHAVAALDLRPEDAERHGAFGIRVDVADAEAVELAVAEAVGELGLPTGLVCAAGVTVGATAAALKTEDYERVMAVNAGGTFFACREVVKALLVAGRPGAIVCVGSPLARVSTPGNAAYGASKAAIGALVRSLAIDHAADGIRVNAVLPGPTETPMMWATADADEIPRLRAVVQSEVPLGRLADPVDVARVALWLLSDEASYVTGAELPCDGGVLAKAAISL